MLKHRQNRRIRLVMALLACVMLVLIVFSRVFRSSDWIRGRPSRTSSHAVHSSPASLAASQRHWRRQWVCPTGAALSDAPVPLQDGWFATLQNGQVVAIDGHGHLKWSSMDASNICVGSGAVAGSNVVVTTRDGHVQAFDGSSGKRVWQMAVSGEMRHGPLAIQNQGTWQVILLSSSDGVMFALDALQGRLLWTSEPTNRSDGAPASDGRFIAYGNCDASVHLFCATNGLQITNIAVGSDCQIAGGALLTDGHVYAGTRSGDLICADIGSQGIVWRTRIADDEAFMTPVAASGEVVMGNREGVITACSTRDGSIAWQHSLSNHVARLCVLDDAVFAMAGGVLSGLRLSDGMPFMSFPVGDAVLGPTCNGDRIAVADDGGNVIVFCGE